MDDDDEYPETRYLHNRAPQLTESSELKRFLLFASAFIVTCLSWRICLHDSVDLLVPGKSNTPQWLAYLSRTFSCITSGHILPLPNLESRLRFVLIHQIAPAVWLLFLKFDQMRPQYRLHVRPGLVRTSGHLQLTTCFSLSRKSVDLQENLEQYFLFLLAQLMSVCYLDAAATLKVVPWLSRQFMFGRVTHWVASSKGYGTFGTWCTLFPTIGMIAFSAQRFVEEGHRLTLWYPWSF